MAKLTVNKIREGLEDHGENYRIERRFLAEPCLKDKDGKDIPGSSPGQFWVVYERVACEPLKHPDTGEHLSVVVAPHLKGVIEPKKLYRHPIIKDMLGQPARTTMTFTWKPVFAGLEEDARAHLAKIAK